MDALEAQGVVAGGGFSSLAGHPGLDLVNTVAWRLAPERSRDDLVDYGSVLAWCRQFGLCDGAEADRLLRRAGRQPGAAKREHAAVREFRDATYDAVVDTPVRAGRARWAITAAYAEAIDEAQLTRAENRFVWTERTLTLATPRHRMARLVAAMLTESALDWLHQCQDEACGYVYLDTSPRRNRRWCSASDCGNRNRVRRHHRRQVARS